MKRTVLPVALLIAISVITVGMVVGASSGAKDPTIAITNRPANQSADASATIQSRAEAAAVVETIQITSSTTSSENWRHPGVAEDSKGNRLIILRGPEGTKYYYTYCPKGGTWSTPQIIAGGNQPALIYSNYANIEIDSSDRFHCEWENSNGAVYASFKDGVWTTPFKPSVVGRYDYTSNLTVRSTDEVVTIDCEVKGLSKDVYLHKKGKNDSDFAAPFNITRDGPGSTQPCLTIDSNDNVWAVWKSDLPTADPDVDNLVIYLAQFDMNFGDMTNGFILVAPDPGWSFLPQVAVNSENKVMTEYSCSTQGQYLSRLYDPATQKLGEIISLNIGLCRVPWHTFFSRMVSHGKDFYAAVMTASRELLLLKFNETASRWDLVTQVSDRGVEMWALYSGYDKMLVAWNSYEDPANVFLTTVGVDPFSKSKIKSVSNLKVNEKNNGKIIVEGSLFHRYYLNALTWTANPDNTARGITITAHRIYRKTRTEDDTKWTRITEVAGTVLKYDDRNIPANSDYVYAVTCVDDKEHESKVY
jgi:hypothetical protein